MKRWKEPPMPGFVQCKVLINGHKADANVPMSALKGLKRAKDGRLILC